jgi:WD40 repeat protein
MGVCWMGKAGDEAADGPRDAFISYSHVDWDFAVRLRTALEREGESIWMDERDIPGGSRWRRELELAIESADAFVFIISPASVASTECGKELTHAAKLNKRILPIRAVAVAPHALPPEVAEHQLIPARDLFDVDFDRSLALLTAVLRSDPDWVRAHTEWGRRALQWERNGRDPGFLLAGAELTDAEDWRRKAPGMQPAPTLLHGEYIDASRQAVTQRLRRTRSALLAGMLALLAAGGVALWQLEVAIGRKHTAQSLQLAAVANEKLGTNPELSTQLALQALQIRKTTLAAEALRSSVPELLERADLRVGSTVYSAAFNPSGSEIVTAEADGTARIWSTATHRPLGTIVEPEPGAMMGATFSPDGDQIATVNADGKARIWSATTDHQIGPTMNPDDGALDSVAYSHSGDRLVTAGVRGVAYIWNARPGGRPLRLVSGDSETLFSASFDRSGTRVVTASDDGTAMLWNADTGAAIRPFAVQHLAGEHPAGLYDATFSLNGEEIVTAGVDGTARIWDTDNATLVDTLTEPAYGQLHSAVFSSGGNLILTASNDGTARIWDPAANRTLLVFAGDSNRVLSAQFSPDDDSVLTASADGTAKLWSVTPVGQLGVLDDPDHAANLSVASSANGSQIVTGDGDGGVFTWDAAGELRPTPLIVTPDGNRSTWSVSYSADGPQILTIDAGGEATVWNAITRREIGGPITDTDREPLAGGALSPDGRKVVTFSTDGWVRVWDVSTGTQLARLADQAVPLDAAFSPDGSKIVVASNDGTARIWNPGSGVVDPTLREPGSTLVSAAAFSPDGKRVVTASNDGSARIWNAQTGRALGGVTEPDNGELTSAAFSPNGREIVTASRDGTARIWDLATGQQLTVLIEPGNAPLYSAAFTSGGRRVVTASADGTTRIWSTTLAGPLSTIERIARSRVVGSLSASERSAILAGS